MRRGMLVGGILLTFLAAPLAGAAPAPAQGNSESTATVEKAREEIRAELRKDKPDYEKIEGPLEELLKKARENEAGAGLSSSETLSEQELRDRMDAAVDAGKYDLAAYYLDRIKLMQDKPNPFGGWLDLTIWTIVVFLLLLFVLGRFAWKPMLTGLQKRESDIQAAVQDARTAREEGQRLREEIQAERNKIEDMRRDILQKAQADAQRMSDEIMTKAKAEMQAERDRMRRDLESAHDQALKDLYEKTADLAALVSSRVMRREMTPGDHRRFVDEALADIRQAGNGQPAGASV